MIVSETIELLKKLISLRSYSGEEKETADAIAFFFSKSDIPFKRVGNNIIAGNKFFDPGKKTILLNSHHDTVKVVDGWTRDPFSGQEENGKIYGLGSNDAGGALVCLIQTFKQLYRKELPYNLIMAATAEEENFGPGGLACLLDGALPACNFGIIGEPTTLEMGVAQKGLIVIDGEVTGKAGHAARNTGINAIYKALPDLERISQYKFQKVSEYLGPTTVQLTQINAGTQHNVIPDKCRYVLDVRVNELYTLSEALDELKAITEAELVPRSMRWHSKGLEPDHPIYQVAQKLNLKPFGSPTLSDQVHCSFPTIKMGPGDSERSHTADEYITRSEIANALSLYLRVLNELENLVEFL